MNNQTNRNYLVPLVVILGILVAAALIIIYLQNSTMQYSVQTFQSKKENSSPYLTEFLTQSADTAPNGIAVDGSGRVWFTLWNETSIAELFPTNGTLKEFHLPESNKTGILSYGIVVDSQKNLVWFTDDASNSVWNFNIADNQFTQYPVPTQNALPYGINLDNKGNVWFTEGYGNRLGEILDGKLNESVAIPSSSGFPNSLLVDNSNRVWFTLTNANQIGSFYGGKFTLYNPNQNSPSGDLKLNQPVGIAMDKNGNLWITQHYSNFISEFNPLTGYFKTISSSLPAKGVSLPYFVQVDQFGNVWFNEHYGNSIAEFIPSSGTLLEYENPTRVRAVGNISGMLSFALSPEGVPWFTELFDGRVGSVNLSQSLNLTLNFTNSTVAQALTIPNGANISIGLGIHDSTGENVTMAGSVGNYTDYANFSVAFAPETGSGNFSTTVEIKNVHTSNGVVFLTLSAKTQNLVYSRIIKVNIP